MTITVSEEINATRVQVWSVITDIDSWTDTISGIISIEVLERPEAGIVGLRWLETRKLFGKETDETMWITAAEANRWYETTAISHGAIYKTRMSVEDSNDKVLLTMTFSAQPTTIAARLMSLMSFMFNGALRKMMQQDLVDVRHVAEKSHGD